MEPYADKITIKAWAEEDRPREKLLLQGRRALSDAELIAILIGSGSRNETAVELSKRILHSLNNDLDKLGRLSVKDLSKFKGIGEAKAISIIAALELGRRRRDSGKEEVIKITSSKDTFELMLPHYQDLGHEEFWVILMSRSGRVISKQLISQGGITGTIADPKVIFKTALENQATSIILTHNHPSGNLKPSQADIGLTHKLCMAGNMLDIAVLDHVIITNTGFFSFSDKGMI